MKESKTQDKVQKMSNIADHKTQDMAKNMTPNASMDQPHDISKTHSKEKK